MISKQGTEIKFPRFIQNKPRGIDKFDGGSQTRLANTIARHFRQNDLLDKEEALPRIIGIEGIWGSGKSNVVKLIEQKLSDEYYFFEYDAWGHQEDLQRRSILELLTSKLIQDKFLIGNTTLKLKGGNNKTVSWPDKLKHLLARKTETVTEKYPLISSGMVAAFLVAVLTPIFTFIAYAIKPSPSTWWFSLISIVIASLPVLIALCVWGWAYHKDHKYGLNYLLAIYHDKVENDICYETLSEDEPTVYEFKAWMQDISDYIKKSGQRKLVIVFDNMDRLPSGKVKELWSSIHTFFADNGFDNIWAIIPFDETHLACAFGDETNEQTIRLTKYFINKTFPIVYRVAPPVITDYRNIIDKFYTEAFGEEIIDTKEIINRIFRIENPNANVREIISFINEMVALKLEWNDSISIINIALFCLKKDEILKNPVEQILSGNYLKNIQTIISNDLQTQREIAALVYGVDVEHARQIPLKKYIEGCINEEANHDINLYSESNKQFDTVLDEVVKNTDNSFIDKIIHCLQTLKRRNDVILHIWQRVKRIKLMKPIEKQEFSSEYKELVLHLDTQNQNDVIVQLYKKILRFKDFNGANYFKAIYDMSQFIEHNGISCDLISIIEEKEVEPKIFIDFLRAANEIQGVNSAYELYQVKTNPQSLDTYLASLLPDKFNHTDIIEILTNDSTYTFTTLLQKITDCIKTKSINKNNVGNIFSTYRLLSPKENRPLPVTLDLNLSNQLFSELKSDNRNINESGYYDLAAMLLSKGQSISLIDRGEIKYIAKIMDFYAIYGDLLIQSLNWNNQLLNETLQYMINHKLGHKLSLEKVLPNFDNIRNKIKVTGEALIEHLADWNNNLNDIITSNNIRNIIPNASFYDLTTRISNILTDHINNMAIEALSQINVDILYNQRANHSSEYWLIATKYLVPKMNLLPNNLIELGKRILADIASGSQNTNPLPDCFKNIFEKIDSRQIKSTMTDIRNEFCNGKKNINATKFKFFEEWFRLYGNLKDRAGEVIDKILKPIMADASCRTLILINKEFYINLINVADRDDSFEFIQSAKNILKSTKDKDLEEFIGEIN